MAQRTARRTPAVRSSDPPRPRRSSRGQMSRLQPPPRPTASELCFASALKPLPLPARLGRGRRLLDGCTAGSPHPWVRRSAPPPTPSAPPVRFRGPRTTCARTHTPQCAPRGESAAAGAALWAPNQLQLQLAAKTHATPSPAHGRTHPPRAGSFVLAFGPARGPAGQELQHPLHAARFALPCTLQLARLRHGTRLSPTRQAATIACLRRHDGLWRVQVGRSGGRQ